MAMPTLESFAQALYDRLGPLQFDEVTQDYALAKLCAGIGSMFQIVEDYSRDQGDLPGWSQLLDINRCPPEALPWLGQFVGVVVNAGLSTTAQAAQIRAENNWLRGTPNAIIQAAQLHLTGTKSVILRERFPDAYSINVLTQTSETPNPAQTQADIVAAKPAGIVLLYSAITGQDYQNIFATRADYNAIYTTYTTYQGVMTNTPGA